MTAWKWSVGCRRRSADWQVTEEEPRAGGAPTDTTSASEIAATVAQRNGSCRLRTDLRIAADTTELVIGASGSALYGHLGELCRPTAKALDARSCAAAGTVGGGARAALLIAVKTMTSLSRRRGHRGGRVPAPDDPVQYES